MSVLRRLKNLIDEYSAAAVTKFAPGFVNHIHNNPDGLVARATRLTFGLFFNKGEQEFPETDISLTEEFNLKASRKIDPVDAPRTYFDVFGDARNMAPEKIIVKYGSGTNTPMTLKKYINDHKTGFRGAIYQDANGHAMVVYGGMDKSQHVDLGDMVSLGQAKLFKRVNQQVKLAQDLYEEAVRTSSSVEVLGYSLGSLLANDMAARLNAKTTTLANIGLPELKDDEGHDLYSAWNRANARRNSVVLKSGNDIYVGKMGEIPGRVIELPDIARGEVIDALKKSGARFHYGVNSEMCDHTPMKYKLASEKFREAAEHRVLSFQIPKPAPTQTQPVYAVPVLELAA